MKTVTGKTGFEYKEGENPIERLRNKLSVLFMVVETGKCEPKLKNEALKVMPEIIEHLENIEDFYQPVKERAFRVRHKQKSKYTRVESYRVVKHRDFVNLDKFKKYGLHLYERYNSFSDSIGEICEMKDGKWIRLSKGEIEKLYEKSN